MNKKPPLLNKKYYSSSSVFQPQNLLREARRQKRLEELDIPPVCILDPDGDILDYVVLQWGAQKHPGWACYHTDLYQFTKAGVRVGIIGKAVGAPFAVLLAEQLFVSGCKLLLSMTSAGQLSPIASPPYFILIEKALRDEGTSYHYLPATEFTFLRNDLKEKLSAGFINPEFNTFPGITWTTDAPYRETEKAILFHTNEGIHAVEMEAAALYAFAEAKGKPVVCFAHVTNQMAGINGDFEKGEQNGSLASLKVLFQAVDRLKPFLQLT